MRGRVKVSEGDGERESLEIKKSDYRSKTRKKSVLVTITGYFQSTFPNDQLPDTFNSQLQQELRSQAQTGYHRHLKIPRLPKTGRGGTL